MVKSEEPTLRKEQDVSESAPGKPYTGDIRIWAGLLVAPLLLLAGAYIFRDAPPVQEPVAQECNFGGWINKPLDLQAVYDTKRPYLFIEKGRTMPPSGVPEMINLELNEKRTVLNVWCG